MRYEIAQKKDIPHLTDLWCRCFGDTESDVREFWKIFDNITVFIARDKIPVSMLCALPVTYFDGEGCAQRASYLYAVCTHAEYRGRGLCQELTAFAEKALAKQGSQLACLVPASEQLFDFYRKLGYQTAFYHKKYSAFAQGKAKIKKIDAATYQNLRQMQLYSDFISYDEWLLAQQGGLYRIETDEVICCAAAEKHGQTLIVKELLPDVPTAASALAAYLGCKCAEVRSENGDIPFGMAKSLTAQPCPACGYLGLAFD